MSMLIVDIDGKDLDMLRSALAPLTEPLGFPWRVSVAIDDTDGGFKIKVNEGVWSPPMGRRREQ